jgi:hypothetical protein
MSPVADTVASTTPNHSLVVAALLQVVADGASGVVEEDSQVSAHGLDIKAHNLQAAVVKVRMHQG